MDKTVNVKNQRRQSRLASRRKEDTVNAVLPTQSPLSPRCVLEVWKRPRAVAFWLTLDNILNGALLLLFPSVWGSTITTTSTSTF
ncbi:hypothetical protein PFLUV_G00254190 [Perca fluviatilis]|uniref:Uncharacterized protein n=1 Tax=Perca fluviatilis TaxID=8168 RepID=A0A6A5DP15_PERFL|nr:hypothetical protein PFLUV_G00254190 [Perca fluviatilis]